MDTTAEKHEQVIALAAQGFAAWKIAEQTGYALATVRLIMQRYRSNHVLPADQAHDTRRGAEAFPHAEVIARAKQGQLLQEIAAASGYSTARVGDIIRAARARGESIPKMWRSHRLKQWQSISKEQSEEAISTTQTYFAAAVKLNISQAQLGMLRAYYHLERKRPLRVRRPLESRAELRDRAALVLRDNGWTYEAIGTALGVSRQRAEQLWISAREAERADDPERTANPV